VSIQFSASKREKKSTPNVTPPTLTLAHPPLVSEWLHCSAFTQKQLVLSSQGKSRYHMTFPTPTMMGIHGSTLALENMARNKTMESASAGLAVPDNGINRMRDGRPLHRNQRQELADRALKMQSVCG